MDKQIEEILNDYSKEVGLINFKNAVKHVWLKQWSCTALIRLVHKAMEEYASIRVKEANGKEIFVAKSGRSYRSIPDDMDIETWDAMTPVQRIEYKGLLRKESVFTGKEIPAGAEDEIIDRWIQTTEYQIDNIGNGYADVTVFSDEKDLFIKILKQYKEALQSTHQRVEYFTRGQIIEILKRYTESSYGRDCLDSFKYNSVAGDIGALVPLNSEAQSTAKIEEGKGLPTDEEIKKQYPLLETNGLNGFQVTSVAWINSSMENKRDGAKWMRSQLQKEPIPKVEAEKRTMLSIPNSVERCNCAAPSGGNLVYFDNTGHKLMSYCSDCGKIANTNFKTT